MRRYVLAALVLIGCCQHSANTFGKEAGWHSPTPTCTTCAQRTILPLQAPSSRRTDPSSQVGDDAHSFTSTVVRVIDGDTIVVQIESGPGCRECAHFREPEKVRVRLAEIDAPEMGTDFGSVAKRALGELIGGQTVFVTWRKRGRYGRIIGMVYLGEVNVCHKLVADGFARRYARAPKHGIVATLEAQARKARKGMWKIDGL